MAIKLGDKARDKITGLQGIAIARHDYLHGCTRWSIQPIELKDGKPVDYSTFDEPQLEVIEAGNVPAKTGQEPGGPRDEPSRPAVPSR